MSTMFTTLATYTSPVEAEIARGLLQDNGIEATLQDNHSSMMLPAGIFGGVKLLVATSDAEVALRLLSEAPPSTDVAD